MSASMRPTRCPARANATATLADTVDLPTPPLPDEIARTLPRCGSSTGVGGGGTPPGPGPGAVWRGAGTSAALLASGAVTRTARTPPRHTLHRRADLAGERAGIIAAEQEGEADRAAVVHGEVLDHAGRQHVAAAARVFQL